MKTKSSWTEASLQNHLATRFNKSGGLCVPNCDAFGWQADLLRVSPRLYCSEYEVKISRADFRADAKKRFKHLVLAGDGRASRRSKGVKLPNRFWYVAPIGVAPVAEVPEYAGLLEIYPDGSQLVTKKAPRLHAAPVSQKTLLFLARGAALRYWAQRGSGR